MSHLKVICNKININLKYVAHHTTRFIVTLKVFILLGSLTIWNNELSDLSWKNTGKTKKAENWFPVTELCQMLLNVKKSFHGCHYHVLGSLGKSVSRLSARRWEALTGPLSIRLAVRLQSSRTVRCCSRSPPDRCAWIVWRSSCEELVLDPITVMRQYRILHQPRREIWVIFY